MKKMLWCGLFVLLMVCVAPVSASILYTKIGPELGWSQSNGLGINDNDEIVGTALTHEIGHFGFFYKDNIVSILGNDIFPSWAINNNGQIAGTSGSHGVIWENGQIIDDIPGMSFVRSINDNGVVVGAYTQTQCSEVSPGTIFCSEFYHAMAYDHGEIIYLPELPGSFESRAYDINNNGQIVGTSGSHVVLWENGQIIDLGTGGRLVRINDIGQIIAQRNSHAALYEGGSWKDLGTLPGGTVSIARDINNNGVIVGESNIDPNLDPNGNPHAFIYINNEMKPLPDSGDYSRAQEINNHECITGNDGDYAVLWQYIEKPPVANAGQDQTVIVNEVVIFDGSGSTDSDGTIESYAWNFGDIHTGSGETTSHTYTVAGTYTVTLTVTDNEGLTGSDTTVITLPTPGSLEVKSSPSHAKIYINGIDTGKFAKWTFDNLAPGDYDVYVMLEGYAIPETEKVAVISDQTVGLHFMLKKDGTPAPEFPTTILPVTIIIGFLGAVLFIQRTKKN